MKLGYSFQLIENCEDAWNESVDGDVTASLDTSDYQVGSGSAKFVIAAGASAGDILATEAITSMSLAGKDTVFLWVKSSINLAAGDLQLLLDNTANCASPLESINLPALVAGTWTRISIALANAGSDTGLVSVGVKMVNDVGAFSLWLDDIRAGIAKDFDMLYVKGLTQPDETENWPPEEFAKQQALNGTDIETFIAFRRIVTLAFDILVAANRKFLQTWLRATDKEIIDSGDGCTVTCADASGFALSWNDDASDLTYATLTVKEKLFRTTTPSSWG